MTVFMMVALTLLADSITGISATTDIVGNPATNIEASASGVLSFLRTFFDILTFNLEGIPNMVNLLFFFPITVGLLFIIVEIVKDIIPFT
jgi:hypothetical protein